MSFLKSMFGRRAETTDPSAAKGGLAKISDREKRLILDFPREALLLYKQKVSDQSDTQIVVPGAPPEAIAALKKLSVDDVDLFIKIRNLSDQADRASYPQDIELYKKVIELAPWDAISTMSIGSCYWNAGRKSEAVKWLEKASQVDPDNARISRNLRNMKGAM